MAWNRRQGLIGLTGLAMLGVRAAHAQGSEALVGVWSGAAVEDGQMSRFRLQVLADGHATLVLIDSGELPLGATEVSLRAPNIHLAWPEYGLGLDGRLDGADAIEAVLDQGGLKHPVRFTRGDRYPRKVLAPPAARPMSPAVLDELLRFSEAPAMGAAWARPGGGRSVLVKGLRSADAAILVRPGDKWRIGSCGKSMNALLIAHLVEAGSLAWTTTVGQMLGKAVPDMRPAYRDTNLLHLLSHHAGLPRDPPIGELVKFSPEAQADPRPERLRYARMVLAMEPVAAPGAKMQYSNAGHVVAAAMAEAATGTPWEVLMTRRVFRPMGLKSAGFGLPTRLGRLDQPSGHQLGVDGRLHPPSTLKQANVPAVMAPAGGAHFSLGDLLTYLETTRDRPAQVLSAAHWATLQTPPFGDGMALGWGVTSEGGLTHDGGDGLWLARLSVDRPSGLVTAVAFNGVTPAIGMAMEQTQAALRLTS